VCPLGLSSTQKLVPCSGHGRCLSLGAISNYADYIHYSDPSYQYTGWDADMIRGCACDSGWSGVNCSLRSCPLGIDPSAPGVDDIQVIDCKCSSASCSGTFQLSIRGQLTQPLSLSATKEELYYAISVIAFALYSLPFSNSLSLSLSLPPSFHPPSPAFPPSLLPPFSVPSRN
jgi:hypothetical protein